MAHVSARPSWLTDPMLAEMRRLRGSSEDSMLLSSPVLREIFSGSWDGKSEDGSWVDGCGSWESKDTSVWLTPAGHAALAAIELEEASPLVNGTLKGETQHVTLSSEIMSGLLHPDDEERAKSWGSPAALEEFDKLPDIEREHIWSVLHEARFTKGEGIESKTPEAIANWLDFLALNPHTPDINPAAFALQVECLRMAAAMIRRGDWKTP